MKVFVRLFFMIVLIALMAIGTVRAQERAEMEAIQRWHITNPCFDSTGKWFTR